MLLLLLTELELYLLLGKTAVMILFRFIFYSNCMNSLHICTFTIISFTLVFHFFLLLATIILFQRSSLLSFMLFFSTDFKFFFVVNQKILNNLYSLLLHITIILDDNYDHIFTNTTGRARASLSDEKKSVSKWKFLLFDSFN